LGHIVPGIFESAEWQAWIELQRAPRLNSFLRFLNALPDPAVVSPRISRQVFEKILHESYKEVLLDDLELLREFCATRVDDKSQSAAEALRALPFLPPRATLAHFSYAGWKKRLRPQAQHVQPKATIRMRACNCSRWRVRRIRNGRTWFLPA